MKREQRETANDTLEESLPLVGREEESSKPKRHSMYLGVQLHPFISGLLPVLHSRHHVKATLTTLPLLQCRS